MTVHLTLFSGNELVLSLVAEYALGLGCSVDAVPAAVGWAIRIEIPDAGHILVELLTHIGLSTTKAGIDVAEPLCRLTSQHSGNASAVTLTFRVSEFGIDTVAPTGVQRS